MTPPVQGFFVVSMRTTEPTLLVPEPRAPSTASAEFDEDFDSKKPTVQVGDPFTEKLLLEACLELMQKKSIVSIQDMGAAGLTSSSIEMAP